MSWVVGDRAPRGIRVVVVGEPVARAELRLMLTGNPGVVVVGEAGAGAVGLVKFLRPDVVVMDGVAALPAIVSGGAEVPVKVVVLAESGAGFEAAIAGGASGYLVKGCRPALLAEALEAAMSGDVLVCPWVLESLIRRPGCPAAGRRDVPLSPRELDIVKLVAGGLTNGEIALALCVSLATVKTHLNHILAKLGLRNRVEVAVWAYRESPWETPAEGIF